MYVAKYAKNIYCLLVFVGTEALKLEIHGRVGIISHAIEERYSTDMSSQYHEYQKFE